MPRTEPELLLGDAPDRPTLPGSAFDGDRAHGIGVHDRFVG
jgi:hypothetical protein